MKRIIYIFAILVMIFASFALAISADTDRICNDLGVNFATEAELSELEDILGQYESGCGVRLRVYLSDDYYTDESVMLSRLGLSSGDDLAVLLIERLGSTYYYELFLYGRADSLISYDASDEILDNTVIYTSIKSGEIKSAIEEFAIQISDRIAEGSRAHVRNAWLVSIFLSLVIGGIAVAVVLVIYKTKQKGTTYPLSKYARLSLDYHSDNFIGSSVTRTRVSSSGSRGGSGGGGSRGRR